MNPTDQSGYAFPSNGEYVHDYGMTLRDYFAGQVITTLCTQYDKDNKWLAKKSYEIADAMIDAREMSEVVK